uniref:Uncharacterized protein n=1 Tax=Oryza punctata TaxID=4537 RepID=A0A0E0K4Q3_ORYPU
MPPLHSHRRLATCATPPSGRSRHPSAPTVGQPLLRPVARAAPPLPPSANRSCRPFAPPPAPLLPPSPVGSHPPRPLGNHYTDGGQYCSRTHRPCLAAPACTTAL